MNHKIKAVDVFVCSTDMPKFDGVGDWKCTDVFNRGTRVGPDVKIDCNMTDVFQCRFALAGAKSADADHVLKLLAGLNERKLIWSSVQVIWAE